MNHRSTPAINAPLFLMAAEQGQTPDAGFAADFQELYSLAMDRAVGIEKASLAAAVGLHSVLIDLYKNAFGFAPELGNLFDQAARAVASCLELQLSLLAIMAPHAIVGSEAPLQIAAPGRSVARYARSQAHPPAEELERSMDIAIGARAA
jgi:hypothetical protein